MDKLREKYIALQKAFWDSDGGAASILALYEFKDELEKNAEKEAKLVLVDVYELLGLKKSACELLGKICDPKDRKQLKKLGYLKQYAQNGDAAAAKFDAGFIQDADPLPPGAADAKSKTEELFKRTPGYFSWQGEHWLACCGDYCEFLGDVGTKELQDLGIAEEVFADYALCGEFAVDDVRNYLIAGGNMAGYLFRCIRCGKYKIYVDAS